MCARFSRFRFSVFQLVFNFDAEGIEPQYNIAPTDVVPVVVETTDGRRIEHMQWGLVPTWSKDPGIGSQLINARAETLDEKPSFRRAFKRRRCLVPADGFFEWSGEKGSKQPYFVRLKSDESFAFAGLWEHWEGVGGELTTFTIVTTVSNELLANLHTRMPVIIAHPDYDVWLDDTVQKTELLMPLLVPYAASEMEMHPVTKAMSNPSFKSSSAIEPSTSGTLFS